MNKQNFTVNGNSFGLLLEIINIKPSVVQNVPMGKALEALKTNPQAAKRMFAIKTLKTDKTENVLIKEVVTQHSFRNREILEKSTRCGCFYCCRIYSSVEITEWIEERRSGGGFTALCPHCGIDSVLPEHPQAIPILTVNLLNRIHKQRF